MKTPSFDPSGLRSLAVSDTGFIFDPRTGHSYSANATGLAVLAGLKEGMDTPAIVAKLSLDFDGGAGIEDDVHQFIEILRDLGLVQS
jgi:hypothetical protein